MTEYSFQKLVLRSYFLAVETDSLSLASSLQSTAYLVWEVAIINQDIK